MNKAVTYHHTSHKSMAIYDLQKYTSHMSILEKMKYINTRYLSFGKWHFNEKQGHLFQLFVIVV